MTTRMMIRYDREEGFTVNPEHNDFYIVCNHNTVIMKTTVVVIVLRLTDARTWLCLSLSLCVLPPPPPPTLFS